MSEKVLYVTDLDGTLLNSSTQLSRRSRDLLNGLIARGLLLSCASARSLHSLLPVTEGLRLHLPIAVYNGAMIVLPPKEGENARTLSLERFTPSLQRRIIRSLQSKALPAMTYAYIDGVECVSYRRDQMNDGIAYYLQNRKGDPRLRPVDTEASLYEGDLFHFTVVGEAEEIRPLYDEYKENREVYCIFQQELYRTEYWCELMPRTANKAYGLQRLREILGCDRVICFGDAANDIPMFKAADEAYAVENAVPELKAEADGIIGGNDADGVAEWLAQNAILPY